MLGERDAIMQRRQSKLSEECFLSPVHFNKRVWIEKRIGERVALRLAKYYEVSRKSGRSKNLIMKQWSGFTILRPEIYSISQSSSIRKTDMHYGIDLDQCTDLIYAAVTRACFLILKHKEI